MRALCKYRFLFRGKCGGGVVAGLSVRSGLGMGFFGVCGVPWESFGGKRGFLMGILDF